MTMPPLAVCDRARQTKDARFDGLFFTGVRSTHIYCRPVCPAPTPKPQNIVYFPSAASAASAGYRPCLRCRPELSPGIRPSDENVCRALALISEGWLEEGSIETLASRVNVSARHLRRLFIDKVGATPLQVHQAHRISVAKQLLTETALPITQVALAAGFASVRRFNDAFHARCGIVPSAVRRRAAVPLVDGIRLRLLYRPPFDFTATLATLRANVLPGIERVSATAYERNVGTGRDLAWIQVTSDASKPELHLHAVGLRPEAIQPLVRRVRRMFDLDADLHAAHEVLRRDTRLAASIARRPGLRIAGAWDGFEWAVAVLLRAGPQAAAASAAPLMRLLIKRYGDTTADAEPGMDRLFPGADALAVADLEVTIGATRFTADALRRLALAVRDCRLDFSSGQPLDDFVERLVECTGMSPLQAHHVAWRALGDCDAWPVESGSPGPCAAAWRPWRGYAAMHLVGATWMRGPNGSQASRAPAATEALP
jgi:AraC family transcriptional regulator, regulatory protein of adaptative response / DNA-3-methyladenine glycosylase II